VTDLADIARDLAAESAELDALVTGLDRAGWRLPTAAAGWTVAHQIAHLAWTDEMVIQAVARPAVFADQLRAAGERVRTITDDAAAAGAADDPAMLLARWQASRTALADALATLPSDARIIWFGPPLRPTSMATARLMETWAHGLDVADALGVHRPPTARLRHVAHLGVRTRAFAFMLNGQNPPEAEVRVELIAPDGACWMWGPVDAADQVTGPALDFCLLVTRRRHRADLALQAIGPAADAWLDIAQAFAGPPGPGRRPSR
jgi:uncharacterized protein (TIGR03084 family)